VQLDPDPVRLIGDPAKQVDVVGRCVPGQQLPGHRCLALGGQARPGRIERELGQVGVRRGEGSPFGGEPARRAHEKREQCLQSAAGQHPGRVHGRGRQIGREPAEHDQADHRLGADHRCIPAEDHHQAGDEAPHRQRHQGRGQMTGDQPADERADRHSDPGAEGEVGAVADASDPGDSGRERTR
jgi:hypothetical protein